MIQLYYTYYESPIGLISIGGTEEYIAELLFIDNAEEPGERNGCCNTNSKRIWGYKLCFSFPDLPIAISYHRP